MTQCRTLSSTGWDCPSAAGNEAKPLCLLGDSSDKQPTMLCGSREPEVRWVSLNHAFLPSGRSAPDPPALCHVRFSPLPEPSRWLPEPRTCSPGWDPRVGTQPSRVAAHLLLSDVQLQLDTELPSTAACLFSNPSFQAPVLNRAPVLQCATDTTLCRSSVPLLSHSFLCLEGPDRLLLQSTSHSVLKSYLI